MYKVFDKETTTHIAMKRKASPWHPDNWVVANGWKDQGDKVCSYDYFNDRKDSTFTHIGPETTLLVGHNIKFDLLWEMQQENYELEAFFKRGGRVWCTQYAEYLLNAQQQKYHMAALNDVAPRYGGTTKVDEVKALWDAGVQTYDIPKDLLVDYLVGTHEENRNGGDIGNTELVFLGQVKKAVKQGQIKMIQDRMDGLCATTEMEYNGLKIDVASAKKRLVVLREEYDRAIERLNQFLPEFPPEFSFNWGSGGHVSCLVFGGTVKYTKKASYKDDTGEVVRFKKQAPFPLFDGTPIDPTRYGFSWLGDEWTVDINHKNFGDLALDKLTKMFQISKADYWHEQDTFKGGAKKGLPRCKKQDIQGEIKYRNTDFFFELKGYTKPDAKWALKTFDGKGDPLYGTDGDIIEELGKRGIPFTVALAERQRLDKEIGTYYYKYDEKKDVHKGMLTCVDPVTHIIHHKLNHTSTVTGRLSSSDPNLQNVTRGDERADGSFKSEVKRMFISRIKGGVMLEIDYSQLEVVVQGVLSNDEQLCEDLRNRVDFHCKRVASINGCTYEEALERCKNAESLFYSEWSIKRTGAKSFSFQRAFGAGAKAIALDTGMLLEVVESLIEAEERTYPGIVRFNDTVADACSASQIPFQAVNELNGVWKTYQRGQWQGPTGTIFSWRSYNAPEWMKQRDVTTFSPPEQKNYPVQGYGGEFVQCMLGQVWRRFVATNNYDGNAYMVNTVHDCVWFDCDPDVVHQVNQEAKEILSSIPQYYNERYGMNITVPFPVDSEAGYNMLELTHLKEKY